MTMEIEVFQSDLDGSGLRIGVVQSRFNEPVAEVLRNACLDELVSLGVAVEDIFVCTVPGALEVPVALQQLAAAGEFDALIAVGAVIRGDTYHFEVVSNESAAGIARVALDFNLPVANAVLTTDTDEQAQARAEGKGAEAARVAIEMANLASSLSALGGDDDEDDEDDYDDDDDDDDDEDDEEDDDEELQVGEEDDDDEPARPSRSRRE
jgi:6,7-dimethyl-8-ribityllumazine synthase